jgi:hypothetical protein
MSGHVSCWLLGVFNLYMSLFARSLSLASSSLGSLVFLFFNKWGEGGQGVAVRMCVDIAVCAKWGPVDRRPRSLGKQQRSRESVRANGGSE